MTRSVMLSFLQNITGANFNKTSASKKRAAKQNGASSSGGSVIPALSPVLHIRKDSHNNLVLSKSR